MKGYALRQSSVVDQDSVHQWWLRYPNPSNTNNEYNVTQGGGSNNNNANNSYGFSPDCTARSCSTSLLSFGESRLNLKSLLCRRTVTQPECVKLMTTSQGCKGSTAEATSEDGLLKMTTARSSCKQECCQNAANG